MLYVQPSGKRPGRLLRLSLPDLPWADVHRDDYPALFAYSRLLDPCVPLYRLLVRFATILSRREARDALAAERRRQADLIKIRASGFVALELLQDGQPPRTLIRFGEP